MSSKVAVFVLIYNDPIFGKRAIESVLAQTYKNIQIMILDNGSDITTQNMIKQFSTFNNVKIIRREQNLRSEFGASISMSAEAEYISFLFSDDFYYPNRIEKMLKVLEESPHIGAVFSSNRFIDENGHSLKHVPSSQNNNNISKYGRFEHLRLFFEQGNSLHPCSFIVRTDIFKHLGGFPPFMHRIGDMTFFLRLLSSVDCVFLEDKLQDITVWKNGRNESARNILDYYPVVFERAYFLEETSRPEFLLNLDFIFPEYKKYIMQLPNSLIDRKFILGFIFSHHPSLDIFAFGARLLFQVYSEDKSRTEEICRQLFNKNFSEVIYSLPLRNSHSLKTKLVYRMKVFLMGFSFVKFLLPAYRVAKKFFKDSFRSNN